MFSRRPIFLTVGVAFLLFLATLSWGPTMGSLGLTANLAGWDWEPMVSRPLLWLLTLPFRLLPAGWVAVALNLFSAAVGAVTLGVLARSVQLLPWDRPWHEAKPLAASLPVLLACAVCGLEFSFWREATGASGEMLDLLVLAVPIWLLLEYRQSERSIWLKAAVFCWGLGMAENWVLLLTLPLFIVAIFWRRKRRYFRLQFLLRLAGWGAAGFAFYFLLPLINSLNPHSPYSFGEAWVVTLRQTKLIYLLLHNQFWLAHRLLTCAILVYFLVPLLACLVRQPDTGAKNIPFVDRFQLWIYRVLRVLLLLACLWLAFDPANGPRHIIEHQFGGGLPLLSFDYLNALGAAFLAGNLLLLLQKPVQFRRTRSRNGAATWWVAGAMSLLGLLVTALVVRNGPAIVRVNIHSLESFGNLAADSLPAGRGIVLSDFSDKLTVFQSALAHRRNRAEWLAVDTRVLPKVAYRAWLERRQPAGWLTENNRHLLTPAETLQLLETVAATNRLFYLHPSYGLFFERFYAVPSGAIYALQLRETNAPVTPAVPAATLAANELFWTHTWQHDLASLVATNGPQRQSWWEKVSVSLAGNTSLLGFTAAPRSQDRLLAEWHSLALDAWGVALQRQEHWPEARSRLEQSLALNTNNLSARISLNCNTNHAAGIKFELANVAEVSEQLGDLTRLSLIMNRWGPFDEPVFDYLLGNTYQEKQLLLQAAQEFERTRTLVPEVPAPELALAQIYTRLHFSDHARPLISHLRATMKNRPDNSAVDLDLALLAANDSLQQTNLAQAQDTLQTVWQQHPDDPKVTAGVINAFVSLGDFTNALNIINSQLAKEPDNVTNLNNQAALLIQAGNAAAALPVLDHLLTLADLSSARLNRAVARLTVQDFAGAEADYCELENQHAAPARVSFGLAAVAERQHATNEMIHYLEICVTNAPADSPLRQQARSRLQALGVNVSVK